MDKDIRLHESNKSFSWSMPDGPYTFFSDEDITLFNEKGYVVLEDAFSIEEVDKVVNQIDPYAVSYTHLTLPTNREV